MKKISIVSLASFAFLIIASAVAVLTKNLFKSDLTALIVGVSILAVSGTVALVSHAVRECVALNLSCFFVSALAMGVLIRAWYINRGFDNGFGITALVSLCAVAYLWVFFALSKIPFIHKSKAAYSVLVVLYVLLSVAAYIAVVLNTKTTFVSTFGYYMIIELAFIFAMSLEVNNHKELIRNLTLSTYSVFAVAIIVAFFVIIAALGGDCDCDCAPDGCCDCGDGCGSGDGKKRKTKKTKAK